MIEVSSLRDVLTLLSQQLSVRQINRFLFRCLFSLLNFIVFLIQRGFVSCFALYLVVHCLLWLLGLLSLKGLSVRGLCRLARRLNLCLRLLLSLLLHSLLAD